MASYSTLRVPMVVGALCGLVAMAAAVAVFGLDDGGTPTGSATPTVPAAALAASDATDLASPGAAPAPILSVPGAAESPAAAPIDGSSTSVPGDGSPTIPPGDGSSSGVSGDGSLAIPPGDGSSTSVSADGSPTTVSVDGAPSTTAPTSTPPAPPAPRPRQPNPTGGFTIVDGRLIDANGNDVVLRGINHPHAWYQDRVAAFAHIAQAGANSIRVVLSNGGFVEGGRNWDRITEPQLRDVIARCQANRLVCVLEVHDTVGFGEKQGAVDLDEAVDYWIDMRAALVGEEDTVIINIGNEPRGNNDHARWTEETKRAITRMRAAGFDHTLMVDATNWGQDWSNTSRDTAPEVFAADPNANTLFSVHMYEVYNDRTKVRSYLESFVNRGLPIVVGEFGDLHFGQEVDEDSILAETERLGIGWLAWSWSGNSGGAENLDLVSGFDPQRLTGWGERLINGPNGLKATAAPVAVFG